MSRPGGFKNKDADGLTLDERRLLQEIAVTGSWSEAAKSLGMTSAQINAKFRNKAFKAKYDELFGIEQVEITQRELLQVARLVGKTYEDILAAEKIINVDIDCPNCGEKSRHPIKVIDYATQRAAASDLAKMTNVWKDQKSIKVDQTNTNIQVLLTGADWLYYERLRRGLPVAPSVYQKLQDKLAGSDLTLPENPVLDGSFRLLEEENNAQDDSMSKQ